MKLYQADNSDLMEISSIEKDGKNLVIEGTIMGAVPVRAIVKPAEVRAALGIMSIGTLFHAASMLFRPSR